MSGSQAVHQSTDDDPTHRSKREKAAPNVDNFDTTATGQILTEGKKALYHCNYCNKDLSGRIRIKCVVCTDFDLCVECFSVGAEVQPHKSNDLYSVMDNLSFPLICADWNADEEMLLLEGLDMYGLANWTEVAEHVGTKSKLQYIDHYQSTYISSPCFPLPDMSHVMGKNKEELLSMARDQGYTAPERVNVEDESPFSAGIKIDQREEYSAGLASGCPADRSVGEKKPRTSVDEEPSMTELSRYNSKRGEFEIEYDNDAEKMLVDMEFKETDSKAERELKLRVLRIYNKKLDERKRTKDFILERKLLHPYPFEKDLTPEERDICRRYRVFMRFSSKEEHEDLLRSVINEHRTIKRIRHLQAARVAGCRTLAEAEGYTEQKRMRESEENVRRLKENSQSGPTRGPEMLDLLSSTTAPHAVDISRAELLSEAEKKLCDEMRILPTHYLNIQQTMSMGIFSGSITKKFDAHGLFNVDPSKVDKVYEMLVKKGVAQA